MTEYLYNIAAMSPTAFLRTVEQLDIDVLYALLNVFGPMKARDAKHDVMTKWRVMRIWNEIQCLEEDLSKLYDLGVV
jgi:hypothetical protein